MSSEGIVGTFLLKELRKIEKFSCYYLYIEIFDKKEKIIKYSGLFYKPPTPPPPQDSINATQKQQKKSPKRHVRAIEVNSLYHKKILTMMTSPTFLKSAISLLIFFTLVSCTKDRISRAEDTEFCSFVDSQDFDQTASIINDFLEGQKKNEDTENLEALKDWLACISCVGEVEILCNSCIYTLPTQSELRVEFIANGQTIIKVLDIRMGERLSFVRYHD